MVQSLAVTVNWERVRRIASTAIEMLTVTLLMIVSMSSSSITPATEPREKAHAYTRSVEFDFVGWMLQAMGAKFLEFSLGAGDFMDEETRRGIVQDYTGIIYEINRIEAGIAAIYADPATSDPASASAALRRDLDDLEKLRIQIEPVVEDILQQQINTVVGEMGLDLGGQALPPVLYHVTPLPLALIISPRDVIRQDADISLLPDLPLDERIKLEERVASALDVSTLVVNVGGVGVYPSMVMETSSLPWLSEVVAHEWVHHFLTVRPLGVNYMKSPELRTINETVASIAGEEIGLQVLKRYYPELVPPPPAPPPNGTPAPVEPPEFDFYKEMHITRVTVDELLEAGKIEAAEEYMEARRQVFWEQGYRGLRKLNQAYFAFHGAYADAPMGAAGEDPVGAAVRTLREQSVSLEEFLRRVAKVTDFVQLQELITPAD